MGRRSSLTFHSSACDRSGSGDSAIRRPCRNTTPRLGSHHSRKTYVVTLPTWCKCGQIVHFAGESRCEDCFARDQEQLKKPLRVNVPHLSEKESAEADRRSEFYRHVFERGGS